MGQWPDQDQTCNTLEHQICDCAINRSTFDLHVMLVIMICHSSSHHENYLFAYSWLTPVKCIPTFHLQAWVNGKDPQQLFLSLGIVSGSGRALTPEEGRFVPKALAIDLPSLQTLPTFNLLSREAIGWVRLAGHSL